MFTRAHLTLRNPESFINLQTHYIKNNWPNFDNIITLSDEDWEEKGIEEFTRLVEKSEKTLKPKFGRNPKFGNPSRKS
jgi:hypothetical protein